MNGSFKEESSIDLHGYPKQYTGLPSGTLDQPQIALATGNTYLDPDSLEFDTFEKYYAFPRDSELNDPDLGRSIPPASNVLSELNPDSNHSCSNCQRLSRPLCTGNYDSDETSPGRFCWIGYSELQKSFLEGCPVCTIIHQGISGFNDSMNAGTEQPYILTAGDKIAVARPRRGFFLVQVFSGRKRLEYNLEIFDDEKDFLVTPKIPQTLDIVYAVDIINHWISGCSYSHTVCTTHDYSLLPTRVLDLNSSKEDHDFKLLVSNGASDRYIALSYCWGREGIPLQTTTTTLADRMERISFDAVPKTFQDAIQITRALGIRYLWIDSLCILQDDEHDWEMEAARMSEVYSNSYLTLAASAGADPEHGLLSSRWTRCSYIPGFVSYSTEPRHQRLSIASLDVRQSNGKSIYVRSRIHLAHDRFRETDIAEKHIEDAPLLTRAWVLQERLLSARTVHFHAEELVWECRSGMGCECGNINSKYTLRIINQPMQGWLKHTLGVVFNPDVSKDGLRHVWLDLVSEYSRLHLTRESDRLPALSGLAKSFSGNGLGSYLCGIWSEDFPRSLLYERVNPVLVPDSTDPIFASQPSWSWASIPKLADSATSYNLIMQGNFTVCPYFVIITAECLSTGSNPYSWVLTSALRVRARTRAVTLDQLSPSRVSTLRFHNDRRTPLSLEERLDCIFVGNLQESYSKDTVEPATEFSLVLRKVPGTKTHLRVGLLRIMNTEFFLDAKSSVFDIV
ncbi:uncharacterized protein PAC_13566 [Phialocephala subalpina]|uniref:Heterokaryon incompatibility domain-containing protein n=1 Tax=Phialocephala subalpina TaxID=576137 RepID=A0A1L7XF47_9HELO|nr:uncharacterized protein PAC_13566 [Phialocephala subalpina]